MLQRFERFSFFVSELSRYWHRIAAVEMEKYGLKGSHSVYLTVMYRHPEGVTAAQLSELCGRDKADVSRMMAIMEEKGLAQKTGGSNTYRSPLKLTDEGRRAAELVQERARLAVEHAGQGLTEEKRAAFYEAMEQIVDNLREISRDGLPLE